MASAGSAKVPDPSNNDKKQYGEDDDEDYDPEQDEEEKAERRADEQDPAGDVVMEDAGTLSSSAHHLSTMQRREVDEAFRRLFGYEWGQGFELPPELGRRERILIRALGRSAAAAVLRSKSTLSVRKVRQTYRKPQAGGRRQGHDTLASSSAATAAKEPSAPASNDAKRQTTASGGVAGGVDKLLKDLSGPTKLSTISKTSSDWETFKSDTGLGERLEEQAQGKDAYLNRKDFLDRVDQRRFELERRQRDAERAKRGI